MRILIILFFTCFVFSIGFSQQPLISPAEVQAELKKRGVTEAEVRAKLFEKGINIDQMDPTNPQQVAEAKKAIEEAITELEAEKKKNNENPKENPGNPTSIEETAEEVPVHNQRHCHVRCGRGTAGLPAAAGRPAG